MRIDRYDNGTYGILLEPNNPVESLKKYGKFLKKLKAFAPVFDNDAELDLHDYLVYKSVDDLIDNPEKVIDEQMIHGISTCHFGGRDYKVLFSMPGRICMWNKATGVDIKPDKLMKLLKEAGVES